jgi:predicted nucleotidyltransferase
MDLPARRSTAKKLLYVLRTSLTGIHLLETGELEPDLARLIDRYGCSDAASLIEQKRAGERVALASGAIERWAPRIHVLFARLDEAREASPLPEEPPNRDELREWLLSLRRSRLT